MPERYGPGRRDRTAGDRTRRADGVWSTAFFVAGAVSGELRGARPAVSGHTGHMPSRPDVPAVVVGAIALATVPWAAALFAGSEQAFVVPVVFVVAGLLGSLWNAERFTTRSLVGVGACHLFAFCLSALAQQSAGGAWWHVLSQVLFVGGFALLLPLAAGYPGGPAPRGSIIAVAIAAAVPVLSALSAATPVVIGRADTTYGPIVQILPEWVAAASIVVFILPLAAATIAAVRMVRGGVELRGRFTLPMAALVVFAAAIAIGAAAGDSALTTALFLVAAPLVPTALVAGSRPTVPAAEPERGERLAHVASGDAVLRLTPREREVLALMAEGHSNPAIGRTLHISLSAVEKHATAIFQKLGLSAEPDTHRRVAAVVAYLRAAQR